MANEYNIPTLDQSLRRNYEAGKVTMRQVREQLYRAGWFNYVPSNAQAMSVLYREGGAS
jgi:hypothetical protein